MESHSIDLTSAFTGRRRAAVASALGSNALEGAAFGAAELAVVHRYVQGKIDSGTMRQALLALPIDTETPEPYIPKPTRPRILGTPDSQIEKMLATLNSYER